ncbi:hypothetical protein [Ornithinimicrobium cerasi]|uniref:hypothetical protein n=1 Tax=Ornithinimicrobium cerasi TaxID=2248773 RepID=UPI000F001A21|nr:hypothetical protein [Ornithinimicrobium cerasi]
MNQFPHGPASGPRGSISGPPQLPTVTADREEPAQAPRGHGAHGWAMWLMCLPMLLIVGLLILSGSAGLGATVYALACLGMMAVMMLFMQHGTRR